MTPEVLLRKTSFLETKHMATRLIRECILQTPDGFKVDTIMDLAIKEDDDKLSYFDPYIQLL